MEKFCKPKTSAARSRTTWSEIASRKFDHQTRTERTRAAEVVVAENRAQIIFDLIDETPLIAAFERDFVISADEVTHLFPREKNAALHDMLSAQRSQHVQVE